VKSISNPTVRASRSRLRQASGRGAGRAGNAAFNGWMLAVACLLATFLAILASVWKALPIIYS